MLYVGLDLSMRRTAICILDATGKVVREVSVATIPAAIAAAVGAAGGKVERVGLEAGSTAVWLLASRARATGLASGLHRCSSRCRRAEDGLPEQERQK